jgi:hypothetical protein
MDSDERFHSSHLPTEGFGLGRFQAGLLACGLLRSASNAVGSELPSQERLPVA